MKRKCILLLLMISAVFGVFCNFASAQDIDIRNMDNEQLMVLLQAIMQKLEQEEISAAAPDEAPAAVPVPTATAMLPEPEIRTFQIYQNKKLILERLPDYYFVNPTAEPEGEDKPDTPIKENQTDSCHESCSHACYAISYTCYYDCYINCAGKEPPPPAG